MKKHYLSMALALAALSLTACDRKATVVNMPPPAAGPAGAQGATGATGEAGKSGDTTVVVVPPAAPAASN